MVDVRRSDYLSCSLLLFACTLDMSTKMTSGCPWQPLWERGHAWLLRAWSWISNVFSVSDRCLFVLLCSSAGDHVLWLLEVRAGSLTISILRTLEYDPLTLCCCCCPSLFLWSTPKPQNIVHWEYIRLPEQLLFSYLESKTRRPSLIWKNVFKFLGMNTAVIMYLPL